MARSAPTRLPSSRLAGEPGGRRRSAWSPWKSLATPRESPAREAAPGCRRPPAALHAWPAPRSGRRPAPGAGAGRYAQGADAVAGDEVEIGQLVDPRPDSHSVRAAGRSRRGRTTRRPRTARRTAGPCAAARGDAGDVGQLAGDPLLQCHSRLHGGGAERRDRQYRAHPLRRPGVRRGLACPSAASRSAPKARMVSSWDCSASLRVRRSGQLPSRSVSRNVLAIVHRTGDHRRRRGDASRSVGRYSAGDPMPAGTKLCQADDMLGCPAIGTCVLWPSSRFIFHSISPYASAPWNSQYGECSSRSLLPVSIWAVHQEGPVADRGQRSLTSGRTQAAARRGAGQREAHRGQAVVEQVGVGAVGGVQRVAIHSSPRRCRRYDVAPQGGAGDRGDDRLRSQRAPVVRGSALRAPRPACGSRRSPALRRPALDSAAVQRCPAPVQAFRLDAHGHRAAAPSTSARERVHVHDLCRPAGVDLLWVELLQLRSRLRRSHRPGRAEVGAVRRMKPTAPRASG